MVTTTNMDLGIWLRQQLEQASEDQLREMVRTTAQALLSADVDRVCGADYEVVSDDRVNNRNGYRTRDWDTPVGTIELAIPKLRKSSYCPDRLLEPRRRAERALVQVIADCYLTGVSTRRADKLVRQLGLDGICKSQVPELAKSLDETVEDWRSRPLDAGPYTYVWVDVLTQRVREGGRIVNVAVVHAVGVNAEGKRETLGMDVITTQDGSGWTAFLRSLVAQRLSGVQLVISEAHAGLQDAGAAVLPGPAWQRCRTHFMRNLLSQVPNSAHGLVAPLLRSILDQPDQDSAWPQHARIFRQLTGRFDHAAGLLAEAGYEILAFTAYPKTHWRQLRSNNPLERLNKEVRRRTDVVGIFPNRAAIVRLLGAVLAEQADEWQVARRYMFADSLTAARDCEHGTPDHLDKEAQSGLPDAA